VHPLLQDRRRLALYLIAWLPATTILAIILRRGDFFWVEAALVAIPLTVLYAFMCLSAFYVCLTVPLRDQSPGRLLGTLFIASVVGSGVWFLLGEVWTYALDPWLGDVGLPERYTTQFVQIFIVGILLYLLAASAHYLVIAFEESREAQKRTLEMQVLAREAELKALRAQIDPHFLFNSLNSISALTVADPQGARRMCLLLADFLRSSLALGAKQQISVSEEFRLVDSFLEIERIRYGRRLTVERNIDAECSECLLPPLLIQPLVENAIRHGIAPLVEGGAIGIEARRENGVITIRIDNPVDPLSTGGSGARNTPAGAGLGLENVRSRLTKLFPHEATVDVSNGGGSFQVLLRFPCVTGSDHSKSKRAGQPSNL
jgi:hypothetical protein